MGSSPIIRTTPPLVRSTLEGMEEDVEKQLAAMEARMRSMECRMALMEAQMRAVEARMVALVEDVAEALQRDVNQVTSLEEARQRLDRHARPLVTRSPEIARILEWAEHTAAQQETVLRSLIGDDQKLLSAELRRN